MTYRGDKTRERERMRRLMLALATTSMELGGASTRSPVAEMAKYAPT